MLKFLLISALVAVASAQNAQMQACGDAMGFCVLGFIMQQGIDMNQLQGGSITVIIKQKRTTRDSIECTVTHVAFSKRKLGI